MQKKIEKKFTHGEHVTIYPDTPESVASATECTGLMPTPPQNDAEFTSYQDLHSMEIPKKLPGKRNFELGVYDDKPEDIQRDEAGCFFIFIFGCFTLPAVRYKAGSSGPSVS